MTKSLLGPLALFLVLGCGKPNSGNDDGETVVVDGPVVVAVDEAAPCTVRRDDTARGVEITCIDGAVAWIYDGATGSPGKSGTDGTPGSNGNNGSDGTNGNNGADGATVVITPTPTPTPPSCQLIRRNAVCSHGRLKYKAYISCGSSEEYIGTRSTGC